MPSARCGIPHVKCLQTETTNVQSKPKEQNNTCRKSNMKVKLPGHIGKEQIGIRIKNQISIPLGPPPCSLAPRMGMFPLGSRPLHSPVHFRLCDFLPFPVGVPDPIVRRFLIVDDAAVSVCLLSLLDELSPNDGTHRHVAQGVRSLERVAFRLC